MRPEIVRLVRMGRFPAEDETTEEEVESRQRLLEGVTGPLTDEEARALISILGDDDYYGLSWAVVHLVESAPGWPIWGCLGGESTWTSHLRKAAENAGYKNPGSG